MKVNRDVSFNTCYFCLGSIDVARIVLPFMTGEVYPSAGHAGFVFLAMKRRVVSS